jgi:hypothetical protein
MNALIPFSYGYFLIRLIPSLYGKFFIVFVYYINPFIFGECDWTVFAYLIYTISPLFAIYSAFQIMKPTKKINYKILLYYEAMCVLNMMGYTFFIISSEFRAIVYYTIKCREQKNNLVEAEIFEYICMMLSLIFSVFEVYFFITFIHKWYIFIREN